MRALQCDFIQIYGMTEHCGCVALLPPEDHDPERKAELLASCGKPLPWVEVVIADPATQQTLAHDQEIGRASCRDRVCKYVYISVVDVSLKKKKQHKQKLTKQI